MLHFKNHAYYIHRKVFAKGYRFKLLMFRNEDGMKSYRMYWQNMVAV